jgi:hypothetical protein
MWVLRVYIKQDKILRFTLNSVVDAGKVIEELNAAREFQPAFRYEIEFDIAQKR